MRIIGLIRLPVLAAAAWALAAVGALASSPISNDPAQVKPGTYQLDPAHGKITWSVSHLGFSTYVGQFADVSATLTLKPGELPASTLSASVDMASLGTLNPALDKVLKSESFFDVAKYPTATFVSTRILRTGKTTATVDGNLTLHGVTQPIVLKITFNQAGPVPMMKDYIAGFSGTAVVKRSEFGMGQYTNFITDDVPIQLEGEFHLQ